jgi:hypothetical protein
VCAFQSFLAAEKAVITILLCLASQFVLWILPFAALQNRQFYLWLDVNKAFENSTFTEKTIHYCA